MNPYLAAHHESAHAVACAVLGMPLQDAGIHIDTIGGGITFSLHRTPGDLANAAVDVVERERTIVMTKAGYRANLKLLPSAPSELAAADRRKEIALLDEMYPQRGKLWVDADERLKNESSRLVDQQWTAIQALAQSLLAKPVTPRPFESFTKWPTSPDAHEQWMSGNEAAVILSKFQLTAIVRSESEGTYYAPDLHPAL
jgi:hypothetical protein